jgi:hypothetical protein
MAGRRLSVRDKVCGARKGGAPLFVNHQTFSLLLCSSATAFYEHGARDFRLLCGWLMALIHICS